MIDIKNLCIMLEISRETEELIQIGLSEEEISGYWEFYIEEYLLSLREELDKKD